jgi:hypothetical protein|tara:strand:+ start:327 stop:482 length:156 start_codon:yes stop_codon:yes gene_type:complete
MIGKIIKINFKNYKRNKKEEDKIDEKEKDFHTRYDDLILKLKKLKSLTNSY